MSTLRLRRWFVRGLAAIGLVFCLGLPAAAVAQEQSQVLVLYGGSRDSFIGLLGDRELPRLLAHGQKGRLDYYSEFIDRARSSGDEYLPAFGEYLRVKYRGHRFEVVIAMDHIALTFLEQARTGLFPDTPVVFFSSRPLQNRPANGTGLIAELNFRDTLALARELQPNLRNVFVVNGVDRAYEDRAREEFRQFESSLAFTYLSALPVAELEARLAALPADSMVYYLFLARDGAGENFNPLDYLERVAKVANAPTYSWAGSAMGRGIVGGSLRDLDSQLREIAALATRVMSGEPADRIPISHRDLNVRQVDWRELRRWNISDAALPAGVLVRFEQPTVWDRYRGYIVGAVTLMLVQSAFIGALLLQRQRRRRAEQQARDSRKRLQVSYERIRDLGARLLNAQEAERGRIARELHDDISQQMALLQIDLELLTLAVSSGQGADLAADTLRRAQEVSKSVHDLSHRLHPSKLRLMGLVAALRGLQHEMAGPGTTIRFTDENVPADLPLDLTVTLFRIAQEAVQNALKHSGAREISVVLSGGPDQLALTIADDGTGFELKGVSGHGLGLISMEERVEAIDGTFDIQSAPGRGTRVDVRVPLPSATAAAGRDGPRAESA